MTPDISLERLTYNEALFRKENERAKRTIETIATPDVPIRFLCECADLSCRERIELSIAEFTELHKNRRAFVIKPGHEQPDVKHVIKQTVKYYVVEKFNDPDL